MELTRFEVLGPLRVLRGGAELDLGFPQQRALLALLLARAGRPVPIGEIVDVLWPDRPPASALNVVRRYVGSLRRLLEPGLPPRAPGRRVRRGADGYLLAAEEDEVDLLRFRDRSRRAQRAVATGRPEVALRHFVGALAEWRGTVAAGIPPAVRGRAVFAEIERELVRTTVMAADAALLCGRGEDVLPGLRRAVGLDALNESVHARLVMALAAAGRQAEALAAFESVRLLLAGELGVAPGDELSLAHTRVLRQDLRPADTAHGHAKRTVPTQLPPDVPLFVGREAELASLRAVTDTAVLLTGMAGVGKTALAVRRAHEIAGRFPDGQLHVRLRGFAPRAEPLTSSTALRGMLTALGLPEHRLPDGTDALAGLYRSTLSGRRVLVLLDDALDTEQVRPLLPASPGCLTLITSRRGLSGLVTAGVRPLRLDPPPTADALALLAHRAAGQRGPVLDEIVARCGRLPGAVVEAAGRAAAHPGSPLTAVAAELRRTQGTLDALPDLHAALARSYERLSTQAARLLRLLPRHSGPALTAEEASALAGLTARTVRPLLDELADLHLITETAPGRYSAHDLVRAFLRAPGAVQR
ncbi:BTAD domain-containing putative transcriptional regulator [Streptomyces sp. NPDC005648]|uniref:AfsR/SARP family transcriptional regulator n=1 Tax=Streptomyces sp. NPDC005648 TaxID=3157044 RepID=UPI0033A91B52